MAAAYVCKHDRIMTCNVYKCNLVCSGIFGRLQYNPKMQLYSAMLSCEVLHVLFQVAEYGLYHELRREHRIRIRDEHY